MPVRPSPARVLGRVRGARPGPMLLCVGGVHGNEPAGVRGSERVLEALSGRGGEMVGDFVALAGNRQALAVGRRFIDRDLNRAWTDAQVERLRSVPRDAAQTVEDLEQVELLAAIEEALASARGPVFVLDLHTTSGDGGPFITFGDTLPNRAFASRVPVPMILGIEEQLEGTLQGFFGRRGLVVAAFETGQHDEAMAVNRAEAGIWLALEAVGLLTSDRVPEAEAARRLLEGDGHGLPRVMEMRHRHAILPEDRFRMDPGYGNFHPVQAGQVVARDARGPVRVSEGGRLLMPLYQSQGEDGFFLIREVPPIWMTVSQIMRRLRFDRVAPLLPGVHRVSGSRDAVRVNKRVARWFALELFHLLGFRREEDAGDVLVLRRRHGDDLRYPRRRERPGRGRS